MAGRPLGLPLMAGRPLGLPLVAGRPLGWTIHVPLRGILRSVRPLRWAMRAPLRGGRPVMRARRRRWRMVPVAGPAGGTPPEQQQQTYHTSSNTTGSELTRHLGSSSPGFTRRRRLRCRPTVPAWTSGLTGERPLQPNTGSRLALHPGHAIDSAADHGGTRSPHLISPSHALLVKGIRSVGVVGCCQLRHESCSCSWASALGDAWLRRWPQER